MYKRVLIVDDIDFILEFERKMIETLSEELSVQIDIDSANSVKEALGKISENNYDAVVIDMHLPDGSGITIAKVAREKNEDTHTAALTIASDNFEEDNKYFDALLKKPITPNTYKKTLSKLLYL